MTSEQALKLIVNLLGLDNPVAPTPDFLDEGSDVWPAILEVLHEYAKAERYRLLRAMGALAHESASGALDTLEQEDADDAKDARDFQKQNRRSR